MLIKTRSTIGDEQHGIIDLVDEISENDCCHILSLPDRKDRLGLLCTSILSIIFHTGVYGLLAYAVVTYPVIYAPSDRDTVWLYASLLPGSQPETEREADTGERLPQISPIKTMEENEPEPAADETVPEPAATEKPELKEGINIYTAPATPQKNSRQIITPMAKKRPAAAPLAPESPPAVRQQKILPVEKSEQPRPDRLPPPQPETSRQTAALEKQPEPKAAREETMAAPAERPVQPAGAKSEASPDVAAKAVFHNSSAKTALSAPPAATQPDRIREISKPSRPARRTVNAVKLEPPAAVPEKSFAGQKTAAVAAPRPLITVKPAPAALPAPAPSPPRHRLAVRETAANTRTARYNNGSKPAVSENRDKSVESTDKTAVKKAMGVSMPPLPGDLKFQINADENIQKGVKVTVRFMDFPKGSRKRGLTKSESRQVRTLSPQIVLTGPNSILAVIENSSEGVYYLRITLDHQESIQAAVRIKLFEPGPKARTRNVGKQTITSNETIVRILMPEGILWDDSSAFSGSMEDSDSVTRYNNETGLVWKEYH